MFPPEGMNNKYLGPALPTRLELRISNTGAICGAVMFASLHNAVRNVSHVRSFSSVHTHTHNTSPDKTHLAAISNTGAIYGLYEQLRASFPVNSHMRRAQTPLARIQAFQTLN
jgi:hypothetical protein